MRSLKRQQGVVLFFSMIVLLIMTIIGVALAVNATQSLRMAGAGSERMQAMISAKGAQDRTIATQSALMVNLVSATQTVDADLGVVNTIIPMIAVDTDCKPSETPTDGLKCVRIEISSTSRFGRSDLGQLTIVAGVEQEIRP